MKMLPTTNPLDMLCLDDDVDDDDGVVELLAVADRLGWPPAAGEGVKCGCLW